MAHWERWNAWTLGELPRLNREILAGTAPAAALHAALTREVLERLPEAEELSPADARRTLVLLGLAGSSVARHHQEADPSRMARPEASFAPLRAGPQGSAFLEYFTRLAQATGAGHAARDPDEGGLRTESTSCVVTARPRTAVRSASPRVRRVHGLPLCGVRQTMD